MSYISQTEKKIVAEACKEVGKKYGVKMTFGVDHHSTFSVKIRSGEVCFGCENKDVNCYWIDSQWVGLARQFLLELLETIKKSGEWYDNSDLQRDYFEQTFYISIKLVDYKYSAAK